MIHYYLTDVDGQPFTKLRVGTGLAATLDIDTDGLPELRLDVTETDPVFSAWLLATPPLFTESDPLFAAWLATPPAISAFTNDAGFLTDISALTASAVTSLSGHNVSELTNDSGYLASLGDGVLVAPDGGRWQLTIDNDGNLGTIKL